MFEFIILFFQHELSKGQVTSVLNSTLDQVCDPNQSMFNPLENHHSSDMPSTPDLNDIDSEDCLEAYINIVNSSSKPIHDGLYNFCLQHFD